MDTMDNIEVIALDLDGTVLTSGNEVTARMRAAVQAARASGIYVAVATGRICGEASEFARRLDADDLMVTSGGASVSSVRQGSCVMRLSIPWEPAVRAAAIVERIGMTAMVYCGESLLITPYDDMEFAKYKSNEGYLQNKQVTHSVAEYIATNRMSVDKIFVRSADEMMLRQARAQLEAIPGLRVMSSAADNLEVVSPIADKGTALQMLCRMERRDFARTAAIGDSENDLEMLAAVSLPIAMENACGQVKALSRHVTRSNNDDGAALAIEKIISGTLR